MVADWAGGCDRGTKADNEKKKECEMHINGAGEMEKMERCGRQMGRELGHAGKTESREVGGQFSDAKGDDRKGSGGGRGVMISQVNTFKRH